jgi:hypothetical protein
VLKQKRNYDRRHRARLLTKVKTNDKVWIKDQKMSGTVKTESNEPRSCIIHLNERKFGNLGFNCFGAIGNKVCNFLPMRSSAGLFPLVRGVAR